MSHQRVHHIAWTSAPPHTYTHTMKHASGSALFMHTGRVPRCRAHGPPTRCSDTDKRTCCHPLHPSPPSNNTRARVGSTFAHTYAQAPYSCSICMHPPTRSLRSLQNCRPSGVGYLQHSSVDTRPNVVREPAGTSAAASETVQRYAGLSILFIQRACWL